MDGPECAALADAIPKPGPLTVDAKPDAMPPGVLGLAGPALGRRRRPETLSSSWRALSPIEPFRWACRRHDHGGGRGGVPHAITGGRSRIGWAEGGGCAAMQAEQGGRDTKQETKNKKCATQGSKKTSISKSRKSQPSWLPLGRRTFPLGVPAAAHPDPLRTQGVWMGGPHAIAGGQGRQAGKKEGAWGARAIM